MIRSSLSAQAKCMSALPSPPSSAGQAIVWVESRQGKEADSRGWCKREPDQTPIPQPPSPSAEVGERGFRGEGCSRLARAALTNRFQSPGQAGAVERQKPQLSRVTWSLSSHTAVLAILLTYPLILHFATHVAGDGSDDPALALNLWWVPSPILNLPAQPNLHRLHAVSIGLNLAYYTLTYLKPLPLHPVPIRLQPGRRREHQPATVVRAERVLGRTCLRNRSLSRSPPPCRAQWASARACAAAAPRVGSS